MIIRDVQIIPAVAIEISERTAETLRGGQIDAGLLGDIGELAILQITE